MNDSHVYGTKQIYPHLDDFLQFRLNRIKEIRDFVAVEIMKEKNE